jgi:acyl-CoA synthetase (AMP-forming)/AMP-acid ligase II
MVEHRSIMNLATALERAGVSPSGGSPWRVSLNGPLAFDTSVKQILQLLKGHTLCIVPEQARFDPEALLAFLLRESIQLFDCTPSQLKPLLAAGLLDRAAPSLRRVLVGGEPIEPETWEALARSDRIQFFNVYGPTECTVDAAVCEIRSGLRRPTVGRPIANTRIHILDDYRQPVPVGVTGELWIGGVGVARGYCGSPEMTAERFFPDPFRPGKESRLYRTGDLGRFLPAGEIELLGRADQQIKVRGFRIELGEIETILAEHPAVCAAVVLQREDGPARRLVAYVIPETGGWVSAESLRAFARQRLPEYMVPSAFVTLAALPLTRNGKVDRRALPAPGSDGFGQTQSFLSPRTPLEQTVADIWGGLLGQQRIGVHDNFFELGGHSLLAVQVLARVRDALNVELPLHAIFAGPTVAEIALAIAQRQVRGIETDELARLLGEVENASPRESP